MLKFIFKASKYEDTIINNEPQSCEIVEWFEIDKLPENIIPGIKFELENIQNGKYYSTEEII